jgi:hypothetical protein
MGALFMYKDILRVFGLLAVSSALPLYGQDLNLSRLTYDIGGGISTPLNPTGQYVGVSGNFTAGVGYNVSKNHAVFGQYMWSGLPPNRFIIHPVNLPTGNINLHTLTANYRYDMENLRGSPFGIYTVAGGGWYYRYATIDKDYLVPPGTACLPVYGWWGYGCDPNGYVYSTTVAYRGASAGGVNVGAGFTIRFGDSSWKFFAESRYHYAWTDRVPTTLVPVTLGIRFN